MSAVATEAALSDQVYTAFLRGNDLTAEKLTELNNVSVIKDTYDAFMQGDAGNCSRLWTKTLNGTSPARRAFRSQVNAKEKTRCALLCKSLFQPSRTSSRKSAMSLHKG